MGDPKKNRKKFSTPSHPWERDRIESERELLKEYALKNKKELWKMRAPLEHYKKRVKEIISQSGTEAEESMLISKLHTKGFVQQGAKLDDVLSLNVTDILERRLQTVVFRKGMARSIKQARQFITHEHITVSGKKISSPAYIVSLDEEQNITFSGTSSLSNPDHPELSFEKPGQKEETAPADDKAKETGIAKKKDKKKAPEKEVKKKKPAKGYSEIEDIPEDLDQIDPEPEDIPEENTDPEEEKK